MLKGAQAQAEAQANRELLGAAMSILLTSSESNASQLRLVANNFRQMASDFDDMAASIDARNNEIKSDFSESAKRLEDKAGSMIRVSGKKALIRAAEAIRNAVNRKKDVQKK